MANNRNNEYEDQNERDKVLSSLSTVDRIKYRTLENDYEIAKQSGEEVPEDKHQYILSQVFKNKRR